MQAYKLADKNSFWHDTSQPNKTLTGEKVFEFEDTPSVRKAEANRVIVKASEEELAAYEKSQEKKEPATELGTNANVSGSTNSADGKDNSQPTPDDKDYNGKGYTIETLKAELDKRQIAYPEAKTKVDFANLLTNDDTAKAGAGK